MDLTFNAKETHQTIIKYLKILDYQDSKGESLEHTEFISHNSNDILQHHNLFLKYVQNEDNMTEHEMDTFVNYIERLKRQLTDDTEPNLAIDVAEIYSIISNFIQHNPPSTKDAKDEWETTEDIFGGTIGDCLRSICPIF